MGEYRMKAGKKPLIILFSGVFILLICIIMPESLAEKCKLLNGQFGMHKAAVTAKINSSDNKSKLTPSDIKKLAGSLNITDYSYAVQPGVIETKSAANKKSSAARIIGTNYMFPGFNTFTILQGGFFTETSEKEGDYIAVIDDRLAWNVFLTDNAVGKSLELYDKTFKIVGVIKSDDSILSKLAGISTPHIYIPGEKMLELDEQAFVNFIQLRTIDNSTFDKNRASISNALSKAGYTPSDFSISDFNIKQALLDQKTEIVIFIMGCIIILLVILWLWNILKDMVFEISQKCRTDYLTNVIKSSVPYMGLILQKTAAAIFVIYLVIARITFKLYIPPEYIPEELIDVSAYINLIMSAFSESIGNKDYMMDTAGIIMNGIEVLTGGVLFIAVLAGLLMIFVGASILHRAGKIFHIVVLKCGLFIFLSLAFLVAATRAAGLPFMLETRHIVVLWAFIYVSLFFNYFKFERKNKENETKQKLYEC